MSRTNRRRTARKPARRVWVFSEPNPDLSPKEIARILASAALEAAAAARDANQEGGDA